MVASDKQDVETLISNDGGQNVEHLSKQQLTKEENTAWSPLVISMRMNHFKSLLNSL